MQDDLIQSFQVEGAGVRGRLVRLGPALDNILGKHDYPEPVAMLLAQALTLAATLASALKFDGVFTLQTKGNGPVSMLVADYRTPGRLRGYASFDRAALDALPAQAGPVGAVPRLLGAGYLAFTVDQGEDTERYQGIVELAGATLADCVHNYFQQSEQLKAGIRLGVSRHADAGGEPHWHAGGLMIQRLPQEGGIQGEGSLLGVAPDDDEAADDAWRRALLMVGSVRDRELTDTALPPNDLLAKIDQLRSIPCTIVQGRYDIVCPISTEVMISGPKDSVRDVPSRQYIMTGKNAVYRPLIVGRVASGAYAMPCATIMTPTVKPAARSPVSCCRV
jgi:molecular chaperone Hsp33